MKIVSSNILVLNFALCKNVDLDPDPDPGSGSGSGFTKFAGSGSGFDVSGSTPLSRSKLTVYEFIQIVGLHINGDIYKANI